MRKEAILTISFGTSDFTTSVRNIDALEAEFRTAHPDCAMYRALTNTAVIDQLKRGGNTSVYAVREVMAQMVLDGVTHLYAQPAYILNGIENDDLRETLYPHKADFVEVECGDPLLTTHEDTEAVARALMADYADLPADEAVVFIAHGSRHYSNAVYMAFDYTLKDLGYERAHIGTFNAFPQIDTIIRHLKAQAVKKVHLSPFMFVAGEKAMAGVIGDAPDSMSSRLKAAGFEVEAVPKCLGEYDGVRRVFLEHLNSVMTEA